MATAGLVLAIIVGILGIVAVIAYEHGFNDGVADTERRWRETVERIKGWSCDDTPH